jgi:predicted dehydrogenase
MYSAAIIGLGKIAWRFDEDHPAPVALTHASAISGHGRIRLAGGASPDPADRRSFEARFQVPAFASFEEMLETLRPDLVSICSPTEFHYEQALYCLNRDVPMIWLEKPPAATGGEISHLMEVQSRRGNKSTVAVNYIRRYIPGYQSLRAILQGNLLGRCRLVQVNYSRGLELNGSHLLDILFYIVGEEKEWQVEWVSGHSEAENPSFALVFEDGLQAFVSGLPVPYHCADIALIGDEGRAAVIHGGVTATLEMKAEHEWFPGFYRLKPSRRKFLRTGGLGPFMAEALKDLIASHEEGRQPISNLQTARRTQDLMAQVRRIQRRK